MRRGWAAEAGNWAKIARTPGYDHSHETFNLPAFLELLPEPGVRTLDLGCGEGRLGRTLRALGHRIVGVDAAEAMVRFAVSHESPQTALLADSAALPFRDEAFDLVIAYMSLHDMDAMPEAVAESARVLVPGGRLCAAIPHPLTSAGTFQGRKAPDAPFMISGSYLDPAPTADVIERGGIRLTFHSEHRPLEAYSRAAERAGLLIEAVREPRLPDVAAGEPSRKRWQRIPMFLHIRAVKPGR
jgi:SAM-dependent methyltransferase